MIIDDSIIAKYLSGQSPESYGGCWVFGGAGGDYMFEPPNPAHKEWVAELRDKLISQIKGFEPRNYELVKRLFPCFDDAAKEYTIMLAVGFPDPYDAMVRSNNGAEYMVFDLIQFGRDALNEDYSCHRVLTHELIHICLHKKYMKPADISYIEDLNYTAFDEGFAHALTYPENIEDFQFTDFLNEKYILANEKLKRALAETDPEKQKAYRISADTGDYWEKFAAMSGKLYILKNLNDIETIYNGGWKGFAERIVRAV